MQLDREVTLNNLIKNLPNIIQHTTYVQELELSDITHVNPQQTENEAKVYKFNKLLISEDNQIKRLTQNIQESTPVHNIKIWIEHVNVYNITNFNKKIVRDA